MGSLWAIACYFNPVGYERRRQNYLAFRRHLTVPLATVELVYRDSFDLPARERYPLLQPFERVYEPGGQAWDGTNRAPADAPLGHSLARLLSLGVVTPEILRGNMRVKHRSNSGLAWVTRRELLGRDGFYDACVMGSGNRAMLCAALGVPADAVRYLQMNSAWAEHYQAWADRHFREVRADIGSIDGTLIHLWHGDLKHRRYQERHRDFSAFDYSPITDIALSTEGSWRWNSQKHAMHAYVADYFRSRREDGE